MVDFTQLNDLTTGRESEWTPTKVKGRTVHIDADIMAYEIAANNAWMKPEYRRKHIKLDCKEYVQAIMYSAGAEYAVCHTTPQGSTKGNRFNQAQLKVYQGNRANKEKPADLEWIRDFLANPDHNLWTGIAHHHQEADDGMAQAMYKARQEREKNGFPIEDHKAVVCSLDKDLRMLEGLHLDWRTHELQEVTQVGELYLEDKKVKGNGLKWFFFQMLAGDTADNIQGIPMVTGAFLNDFVFHDTKPRKNKKCGQMMALQILNPCNHVFEMFEVVARAYEMYGDEVGFTNYQDEPITSKQAFLSEAYLLWMRETDREKDFNRWIHESGNLNIFKEIFYDE